MNKKINLLRERLFNMEDFSHRTTEGKNKRFIYANKNLYTGANPQIRALEILKTLNEIKQDKLKGFEGVGGWKDKKTGIYYADFYKTTDNKQEAIKEAKKLKELAIYDSKQQKEIIIK